MKVCCCCQEKKKSTLLVYSELEDLIRKHIYEGYDRDINAFSSYICTTCKAQVYALKRGDTGSEALNAKLQKVKLI